MLDAQICNHVRFVVLLVWLTTEFRGSDTAEQHLNWKAPNNWIQDRGFNVPANGSSWTGDANIHGSRKVWMGIQT